MSGPTLVLKHPHVVIKRARYIKQTIINPEKSVIGVYALPLDLINVKDIVVFERKGTVSKPVKVLNLLYGDRGQEVYCVVPGEFATFYVAPLSEFYEAELMTQMKIQNLREQEAHHTEIFNKHFEELKTQTERIMNTAGMRPEAKVDRLKSLGSRTINRIRGELNRVIPATDETKSQTIKNYEVAIYEYITSKISDVLRSIKAR